MRKERKRRLGKVRRTIVSLARIVGASTASALLSSVCIAVSGGNPIVVFLAVVAGVWLLFEGFSRIE